MWLPYYTPCWLVYPAVLRDIKSVSLELQPSLDGNGKGGELGQSTTLVDVGIVLKIMWKRAEESITGIINN